MQPRSPTKFRLGPVQRAMRSLAGQGRRRVGCSACGQSVPAGEGLRLHGRFITGAARHLQEGLDGSLKLAGDEDPEEEE